MIISYKLENCHTFSKINIENLNKGLIVFTGPSGSGKSVLMNSILGTLSLSKSVAQSSQIIFGNIEEYNNIDIDVDIESDFILKQKQNNNVNKYSINNEIVTKKNINSILSKKIKHLSLKDYSDFENKNLINLLDNYIYSIDSNILKIRNKYEESLKVYEKVKKDFEKIIEEESKVEELKDFLLFEIEKIKKINPKLDEEIELIEQKKLLSRKDKIEEQLSNLSFISDIENNIYSFLNLIEKDISFISEPFSELFDLIELEKDKITEVEDINIEEMLDRIEDISSLIKKYGSIKNTLVVMEEKEKELDFYNNISFEKSKIEKKLNLISITLNENYKDLFYIRKKHIRTFNKEVQLLSDLVYLENTNINLLENKKEEINHNFISIELNKTPIKKISTGELNRLRLVFLTLNVKYSVNSKESGVLFLDEIDANLSGEESMSVAKLLKILSEKYQIFAISHQPQLTSCADIHIKINKKNNLSTVETLNQEGRIKEIARMISGDIISKEALNYSKKLILK